MTARADERLPPRPSRNAARGGIWTAAVLGPLGAFALGVLLAFVHVKAGHVPLRIAFSLAVLGLVFWTVFIVLRHAEAIAHRIGEPYGTLVLTFAVTTIEASIIVSVMLHGEPNPGVARESVFSTVMIVCAGFLGICFTVGGWRHRHQDHKRQGTSALLSVVVALSVLTLVMPNYTFGGPVGGFATIPLVFVSLLCLLLYGSFVFAQMTRHRDDFLDDQPMAGHDSHAVSPYGLIASAILLAVGLTGIVLLAEHVAASVEDGLAALEAVHTDAIVGAFIATLVLLPEMVSAIKASLRNEVQRSLNIALGSACATIGLTIPVVAAASLVTGTHLIMGLSPGDTVLLALTLAVSIISFGTGRTTVLTGAVHLVVFVAYLLLIAYP